MNETTSTIEIPKRPQRLFIPEQFELKEWKTLEPYLQELQNRPIHSAAELEKWMLDRSELESIFGEEIGWRYIRMTIDTQNEAATEAFQYFVTEIEPNVAPYDHALNQKLMESPYLAELDQEKYRIYLRSVRRQLEIFREENIPLKTEITTKQQQYAAITGAMTVTLDGQEMTLQRAADRLKSLDENVRRETYLAIQDRRLQDKEQLDDLFSELTQLRHQVAINAGYFNFRDYMFAALGRFDYTAQDCFDFHAAIRQYVVPLNDELDKQRKSALQLNVLKPWDLDVDESGKPPLEPFKTGDELLAKTIQCFYALDPFLGDCLVTMQQMGHLDLESRKGKAPGGYNYPLEEIGVPFIFMNATSSLRDVVTLLHEGGHAVHSFLTRMLPLNAFKQTPSEVAELASMSMELISMDHWGLFFSDADELRRAKKMHLESVLETFPWVATIDKFQHWVYENPNHTLDERHAKWVEIFDDFNQHEVNWAGLEHIKPYIWQKQLHLYEVPFYYIEYAMAQLGAIAVWKNFKENPKEALDGYKNALKLGYTASIGEVYAAANIKFDFSDEYIQSLTDFVRQEMAKL
ncbi:M3 family oligoendopeptidase [Adhaeribacter radiodurans]|uniref:M3 family oligoendopeptidase n=1 Tax=Adhaeribacter radiodurans TaxID=2745197 RepID=A0A7L7L8N9_9BACT|nr:M3 family oligoendopeptidase [Adhaeribacter radiodurans]QMU29187.1 M3 family oligoendopeptidase [Adhaeribacter radiodurans]